MISLSQRLVLLFIIFHSIRCNGNDSQRSVQNKETRHTEADGTITKSKNNSPSTQESKETSSTVEKDNAIAGNPLPEIKKITSPIQDLSLTDGLNLIFIYKGNNTSDQKYFIVNSGYGRHNLFKEEAKFFRDNPNINSSDYSLVIGLRNSKYRLYGIKSMKNERLSKSMIKSFGSSMNETMIDEEDFFCLDSLSNYQSIMLFCEPSISNKSF